MDKIKVLHIGIKNWPYNANFKDKNILIKGGGSNKYSSMLINSYSNDVQSYIVTQLSVNQLKYEIEGENHIFRVKTFGARKIRQIVFNLKAFFLSLKLIKNEKIQIIHGHMLIGIFFTIILGKLFSKQTLGTPYSIYTTEFKFPIKNLARLMEKYLYKFLNVLVFESEENKIKSLQFLNANFKNAISIKTGIDIPIDKSPLRADLYYSENKIKILFIGRIVNIKALDNFVLGVGNLNNIQKEKIEVNIIGEGEEFSKIKDLIQLNKLEEIIFLKGFVKDLNKYFLDSDIFILPSHMEGLSLALLEAISYGLACIINDFSFPHSNLLYIMKNNDEKTIYESLAFFIDNPSNINKFKSNSLRLLENNFTLDTFSKGYVTLYRKMIN